MHSELKKRADDKDIRWLQYGFADCLDVDPTFEEYKEDFNYCCENVPEMFEKHMELTPRRDNQHSWTDDYWNMLKVDLLENFSRERFEHMRSVAKVVYAEKIARLEQERRQELETEQRHRELEQKNKRFEEEEIRKNHNVHRRVNSYNISSDQSDRNTEVQLNIIKPSKQQEQELERDRKKLEQENSDKSNLKLETGQFPNKKGVGYERIFCIEKIKPSKINKTSVKYVTEFELSQTGENYLRVRQWKETKDANGSQKSKITERQYKRIVSGSAETLNCIDRIGHWKQYERMIDWQGNYKVIAYKKCDPNTNAPQYYKVIKRDKDRFFYELIQ